LPVELFMATFLGFPAKSKYLPSSFPILGLGCRAAKILAISRLP